MHVSILSTIWLNVDIFNTWVGIIFIFIYHRLLNSDNFHFHFMNQKKYIYAMGKAQRGRHWLLSLSSSLNYVVEKHAGDGSANWLNCSTCSRGLTNALCLYNAIFKRFMSVIRFKYLLGMGVTPCFISFITCSLQSRLLITLTSFFFYGFIYFIM